MEDIKLGKKESNDDTIINDREEVLQLLLERGLFSLERANSVSKQNRCFLMLSLQQTNSWLFGET